MLKISFADSVLLRGFKKFINVKCFRPEAPTDGVLGTAFATRGVSLTEFRKIDYSFIDNGLFATDIVRLRVFERILRNSSFPTVLYLTPLDLGE